MMMLFYFHLFFLSFCVNLCDIDFIVSKTVFSREEISTYQSKVKYKVDERSSHACQNLPFPPNNPMAKNGLISNF